MNTERLAQLADFLEKLEDRKFSMSHFAVIIGANGFTAAIAAAELNPYECKSAACIAGWAVWLWGNQKDKSRMGTTLERIAQILLDLTIEESRHLFHGYWSDNQIHATKQEAIDHLRAMAASR